MVCGLALLASGQALAAANYASLSSITSADDFKLGSKWTAAGPCGNTTAVGGTITPVAGDYFNICDGHSLTLAVTDVVNFGVLGFAPFGTWTASGVLKFSSGDKTIGNLNSSLAAIALNVSSMTTGDKITIFGITGVTAFKSVTFSGVTGGTLSCTNPFTAGSPLATETVCTVTVTPPPTAPTSLSATAASPTQINLSWTDASSDETGFKIFRNGTELTPSPKVGAGIATFSDTGLTCNTSYTYTVKATNANGDSTAAATTPTTTTTSACTSGAVSAPIFSTKEKPAVFSEEVK